MALWEFIVWPFVAANCVLLLILFYYIYQYYRLRNIAAIKKRRVKFMLFFNCVFVLLFIRFAIFELLFDLYFYTNGQLQEILSLWTIINIQVCSWFTFLKFWLAYFDIKWMKSCERNKWKVNKKYSIFSSFYLHWNYISVISNI